MTQRRTVPCPTWKEGCPVNVQIVGVPDPPPDGLEGRPLQGAAPAGSALAGELRRHPLVYHGVRCGEGDHRYLGVVVHVDEPGGDHEPPRVQNRVRLRGGESPVDIGDLPLGKGDVRVEPGCSRPVDHVSILD